MSGPTRLTIDVELPAGREATSLRAVLKRLLRDYGIKATRIVPEPDKRDAGESTAVSGRQAVAPAANQPAEQADRLNRTHTCAGRKTPSPPAADTARTPLNNKGTTDGH